MKRILQVLNLLSVIVAIMTSYLVNGKQEGKASIGEISAQYDNLLTPAGYAFGIWGLIYIALLVFGIYQLMDLFKRNIKTDFVLKIGWWFILANITNAAWVYVFTNDQIGLSVILMLVVFVALLKIVINLNMERWDAPTRIIVFIWWPLSLYFGWINVALITNLAAYFVASGWNGDPLSAQLWAIIILVLASVVFIAMIWTRNMREYANVAVWGFIAIAVKNWDAEPAVAWVALAVSVVIFVNAALHGYKNRATAPFSRTVPYPEQQEI
jgi:hypothetical protein